MLWSQLEVIMIVYEWYYLRNVILVFFQLGRHYAPIDDDYNASLSVLWVQKASEPTVRWCNNKQVEKMIMCYRKFIECIDPNSSYNSRPKLRPNGKNRAKFPKERKS